VTGLVDHVARRRRFVRSARLSATVYLLGAAIGGVVLSVLAAIYGHRGLLALLPAIDYLAFALAAGLCAGAVQRLRREQRRLSGTITHSQRASREGSVPLGKACDARRSCCTATGRERACSSR
jgi:predicted lysophospholipase L1 biosynthesis ABC-type transport system permease subunit